MGSKLDKSIYRDLQSARGKVRKLGIESASRQVLFCADKATSKCAGRKQMAESWNYLKRRLKELKLEKQGGVLRLRCYCLGVCKAGPIAVVMPDNCWYGNCTPDVLERIVQEHLVGGSPVEEFLIAKPQELRFRNPK